MTTEELNSIVVDIALEEMGMDAPLNEVVARAEEIKKNFFRLEKAELN